MTITVDFNFFDVDVPIVTVAAGGDFDFSQYEAPVVSTDQSTGGVTTARRRASID